MTESEHINPHYPGRPLRRRGLLPPGIYAQTIRIKTGRDGQITTVKSVDYSFFRSSSVTVFAQDTKGKLVYEKSFHNLGFVGAAIVGFLERKTAQNILRNVRS